MPWSRIGPLKHIFDRTVPTPGSQNTPNVAKFKWEKFEKSKLFEADFTAGLKLVVSFDDENPEFLFGQDTGQQGNGFAFDGNYFNMNAGYLKGDLLKMVTGSEIFDREFEKLDLKPEKKNPNKKQRSDL